MNLYFTHGVKTRTASICTRFVETASTQAAKLFGLFPRKGAIQLGSDADLVVYDPNYRGTISAKTQHDERRLQRLRRLEIEGRPHVVTVRGEVAVRDGVFVGEVRSRKISRARADTFLKKAPKTQGVITISHVFAEMFQSVEDVVDRFRVKRNRARDYI